MKINVNDNNMVFVQDDLTDLVLVRFFGQMNFSKPGIGANMIQKILFLMFGSGLYY